MRILNSIRIRLLENGQISENDVGGIPILLYTVAALLPTLLLLVWLYTRDTLHPEPKKSVYKLFLLGAGVVLPAGLLERMLLNSTFATTGTGIGATIITAFFVAGMVEEFLKAAVVERAAVQKGIMKTPMDCIVYCGATALGFATIENILYVTSDGFSTAILRSVTAVPAHLMFGITMGVFFSRAIQNKKSRGWAYIVPALAHGIYDTFALSSTILTDVLLVLYLGILLEWSVRKLSMAKHETNFGQRVSKPF